MVKESMQLAGIKNSTCREENLYVMNGESNVDLSCTKLKQGYFSIFTSSDVAFLSFLSM